MSRRATALALAAAAVLAIAALLWWLAARRQPGETAVAGEGGTIVPGDEGTAAVELFFPSTAGWLDVESRELPVVPSAQERAAQVAAALLEGPAEAGHVPPLAGGVSLAGAHLTGDGVLFLDLAAAELAAPPVSGSRWELLSVYSFVNSILANVPEARGVVLLWNGSQRPTFAGHVDTTRPLVAEPKWQARR